jgi:segregation and condensation protein A
MSYEVKIDAFEGPIPLLLHLIKNNEVEIYDISISEITAQYLGYIAAMQKLDLEIASEFLIMAANLIEIKSSMLLPDEDKDEDEEEELDPRQQLINRLLEYKKYKELAAKLQSHEEKQRKRYTRNVESIFAEIDTEELEENPLEDISLQEFVTTFENVLAERIKEAEKKEEKAKDKKEKLSYINEKNINIQDKICDLEKRLKKDRNLEFNKIFEKDSVKLEIVVTFMALLELMKLRKLKVKQNGVFGKITIHLMT